MNTLKVIMVMIALILATASASAIDTAPTIQITSNPSITTESTATVTVLATDVLDNAGIYQIKFYVNNALEYTKDCAYSTTCVLTRTRINSQAAQEFYYATTTDRGNNTATSSTINLTFLGTNTPPTWSNLPNKTILEDSGMNFNLTDLWEYAHDSWTPVQNMTYLIISQSNTSLANCMIDNNRYLNCTTVDANATGNTNITVGVNDSRFLTSTSFWLTVQNVNDAPELILSIPGQSVNEDESNITINITQYFADIDSAAITYSFATNTSALTAELTGDLLNITGIDNKYGTFPLTIIASDGEFSVNTTINVVINSINDAPLFLYGLENKTTIQDLLFIYQLNYTDIDGDTITYTDDSALFVINSATGLISFTPSASGNYTINITITDSGTPALQTSQVFNLEVKYLDPPQGISFFIGSEIPMNLQTNLYVPDQTYIFGIHLNAYAPMDTVLLNFNGTNYTATYNPNSSFYSAPNTTGLIYEARISHIPVGAYLIGWFGNYTNGISTTFPLSWNFTINPANPGLNISLITPTVYGTNAEVNCTVQTQQGVRNLQVDSLLYPFTYVNTENMTAGMHNFTCTFGGTSNYTTAKVLKFLNITKAPVSINVVAPETVQYGQITNASCNLSVFAGTTLNRNGTGITSPDTTLLAAGEYNYTCYWNGDANHYGATDTKFVTVQKAEPVINLTVNRTTHYVVIGLPGMLLDINGTITTPAGGNVDLYINNTLQAGINIAHNFTATVPVTLVYNETENYSYSEKTINVYVGSASILYNWTYPSGSHFNRTFFSQEFDANKNVSCRWSWNDTDYNSIDPFYTFVKQSSLSGLTYWHIIVLPGNFGLNNIFITCANETSANNRDFQFYIDNIISDTQMLNNANARNSTLRNSTVDSSTLYDVRANYSIINNSVLTNCSIVNSIVKDKTGSNCYIINSVVDPSDVTNSTINSSTITNSNATNSYVDHSTITNSDIDSSTIINSDLTNVTGTGTVTSTTLQDVQLIDAVIDNGIIYNGTIIQGSITYNASSNVTANISTLINIAPTASFTTDTTATTPGTVINFDSSSTTDPNIGQLGPYNSTNMTYYWDFGDGTNLTTTNTTTTHSYSADGTYIAVLTATDAYGLSDNDNKTITISTPAPTPPTYSSSGGGGGGSGGGSLAAMARIYEYDLESGMFFQRGLTMYDTLNIKYGGKTYVYKVTEIKRAEYAVITINNVPYKFINKEIKQIDLDGNHYYDIEISFINNYVTRAEFRMKPVHELVPGYNPNAPAQTTVKPGQSAIIDKLQEAQKQLDQENEQEEETEQEPTSETTEEGPSLLSAAVGLAKTLVSSMKGTVTGAVTAGAEIDEKGGATGTIITILVVVLGLLGYWAYNRFF